VKSPVHVASPPAKPLLIYDGACDFCKFWIQRWQHTTGDQIDYLPFQDGRIAAQFPELPRENCESAVQLIEPDGEVYSGAEAALRGLAAGHHHHWLLDFYYDWPFVARLTEWCYAFVASHRRFFSVLTRLAWGREVAPPTHQLVRSLFLRSLGLIYLAAFVSLGGSNSGFSWGSGCAASPSQRWKDYANKRPSRKWVSVFITSSRRYVGLAPAIMH